MAEQDYFSVAEFAALTRVSQATVRRLIDKGEIPTLRLGVQIRIPRTALDTLAKRPA